MSKINNENYLLIQGWMINELNLKGNELLIYAIIYGFSQEENQTYNGSLQYLADWTNSTKQGVILNLKSLINKGYIVKKEKVFNGVKFCEYYSTKFNGVLKKVEWGIKESLMGGIKESLPNNIDINNIDNNIDINNKPKKNKFGKFQRIKLTEQEYERLCKEFGTSFIERQIDLLDEYVESNNNKNKYTNFNLVLRKSIRENWFVNNKKNIPDWLNKKVEVSNASEKEQEEIEKMIKEVIN